MARGFSVEMTGGLAAAIGSEGKSGMLTLPGVVLVAGFGAGLGGGGTGVGAMIFCSAGTGVGTEIGFGAGTGRVETGDTTGAGLMAGAADLPGFASEGLDVLLGEAGTNFLVATFDGGVFLGAGFLTCFAGRVEVLWEFLVVLLAGATFLAADFLGADLVGSFFLGTEWVGF